MQRNQSKLKNNAFTVCFIYICAGMCVMTKSHIRILRDRCRCICHCSHSKIPEHLYAGRLICFLTFTIGCCLLPAAQSSSALPGCPPALGNSGPSSTVYKLKRRNQRKGGKSHLSLFHNVLSIRSRHERWGGRNGVMEYRNKCRA